MAPALDYCSVTRIYRSILLKVGDGINAAAGRVGLVFATVAIRLLVKNMKSSPTKALSINKRFCDEYDDYVLFQCSCAAWK
jgi:hypothetical protein